MARAFEGDYGIRVSNSTGTWTITDHTGHLGALYAEFEATEYADDDDTYESVFAEYGLDGPPEIYEEV